MLISGCKGLDGLDITELMGEQQCKTLAGTIRVIKATGVGLVGHLQDSPLHLCTELVELGLSDNRLTGHIPTAWKSLTNIVGIQIWSNHLTGHFPQLSLPKLMSMQLPTKEIRR